MTYEMLKKAVSFAWSETTSRPKEWLKLVLFTGAICLLRYVYNDLSTLLFRNMQGLSGLKAIFSGILFAMALPVFYFIYYWYIALFNIVIRNALDAAQQKPLRMFSRIVHNHSLVWTPALIGLVFLAIMTPSLLLLTVVRGLQTTWYSIAIALTVVSAVFAIRQMVHYFFSMIIVLDKEVTPDQALKQSYKLTTGSILGLFSIFACMFLLASLIGLVVYGIYTLYGMVAVSIVATFLYSFLFLQWVLIFASLYQQLSQGKK